MPQVRLPFIPSGFLNTANSPTSTGMAEPITGLALSSGMTAGMFADYTRSEALKLSKTSVGTLLEGRYMWVRLDPSAVVSGNGQLQRGQLLFWVLGGTNVHQVTNVEPTGASMIAGIFVNTISSGAYPVTPGNWFFMQVLSPGRASILFRSALGNSGPAVGDGVFAAGAGAGANAALADDIGGAGTPPTLANIASYFGRFIGVAETAPAASTVSVVQIQKPGPCII